MNLDKRILELIELLSEYLRKTDRVLVRMEKHDALFEKQFARMDLAYQVIVTHSEKIESLEQQTQEIREESRKEALKRDAQSQTLMNELISLSKRVQTVEGKH